MRFVILILGYSYLRYEVNYQMDVIAFTLLGFYAIICDVSEVLRNKKP